jgi:hypothetical protein
VRKTGGVFIGDDGIYIDFDGLTTGTSYVSDWGPRSNSAGGLIVRFTGSFGEAIPEDPGLDPVPEPATILLFGTGLLAGVIRKQRH